MIAQSNSGQDEEDYTSRTLAPGSNPGLAGL